MSTLGDIFEGEQMDCTYKWGACYLNENGSRKNAEGDLVKFKGPNLFNGRTLKRGQCRHVLFAAA